MDTEKAIEFLIESSARHETQLIAIRNVIEGGMKLIAGLGTKVEILFDAQLRTESRMDRLAAAQEVTEQKFALLAEAQTITEKKLGSLIDSLNQPRNGHDK
jgi:hypothetical protein